MSNFLESILRLRFCWQPLSDDTTLMIAILYSNITYSLQIGSGTYIFIGADHEQPNVWSMNCEPKLEWLHTFSRFFIVYRWPYIAWAQNYWELCRESHNRIIGSSSWLVRANALFNQICGWPTILLYTPHILFLAVIVWSYKPTISNNHISTPLITLTICKMEHLMSLCMGSQ